MYFSAPEPDAPAPETKRLPLPIPEFNPGNVVTRVLAAIVCVLLMGWIAPR